MTRSRRLPSFIFLLMLMVFPPLVTAKVITIQGFKPIPLLEHLTPVTAPETIYQRSPSNGKHDQSRWYQFSLKNNDQLTKLWLIQFRAMPHKRLDFFIPSEKGYLLKQLGTENRPTNKHSNTVRIRLSDQGDISDPYYIRIDSPYPNQFAPALLPESVNTLERYKTFEATMFFQGIAIFLLATTLVLLATRRKTTYYLLTGHLLSITLLLLFSQQALFQWLPPVGDPGHWMILATTLTLITAVGCYQQITQPCRYADYFNGALLAGSLATLGCALLVLLLPEQGALLLPSAGSCTAITLLTLTISLAYSSLSGIKPAKYTLIWASICATGFAASALYNPWPRSIPTLPEYGLIIAQAVFLIVIHWYNNQLEHTQAASISILNQSREKRRVFEADLRQHLIKPESPFPASELPIQVLNTLEVVLPDIPATVMTRHKQQWTLTGTHKGITEHLQHQLPLLHDDIDAVMKSNEDSRINIKDARGTTYWLMPLETEISQQTVLVLNPVIRGDTSQCWHTACDVASHSRMLYKSSRQAFYWQSQTHIDQVTGLPDKHFFIEEAGNYLSTSKKKQQPYGCLIMLGMSGFKQLYVQHKNSKVERILTTVAKICNLNLRQQDLLSRYDDSTFTILLPETNPWQAWQVAERLYKAIDQEPPLKDITVSIGLSAYTAETQNLEKLLQEANQALQNAQIHSKNRIIRSASCHDHRLPS